MTHMMMGDGPRPGSILLTKCTRWEVEGGRTNTRDPGAVTCPDCLKEMRLWSARKRP